MIQNQELTCQEIPERPPLLVINAWLWIIIIFPILRPEKLRLPSDFASCRYESPHNK